MKKKRPVQQVGTDIKSMLTERRHFLSASKRRVARLSVRTNEARVVMQLHVSRMSSFKKWGLWLCNTTRLEEAKERFIIEAKREKFAKAKQKYLKLRWQYSPFEDWWIADLLNV